MVIGKQVEVLDWPETSSKTTNGLYPGTLLGIIDFTQVKQGLWYGCRRPATEHFRRR